MLQFRFACILIAATLSSPCWSQANTFAALSSEAEAAYHSGDYARARALSAQALTMAGADAVGAIDQLARLGAASEKLRDYSSAEQHYRQMLAALEKLSGPDSINAAFGMEALARTLVYRRQIEEAEALFRRVVAARRVMVVAGQDPFKIRHETMRSLLALAREDWQLAFDGYRAAIGRLSRTAQVNLPDTLEGLASETNVGTFIGLARAAWNLQKSPGHDAGALMDATFRAVQWKWRTAAGEALLLAAERANASSSQASKTVRREQDKEERLRRLKADAEALEQAWISKRESDPEYRRVWDRQMVAWQSAKPEDMIRLANEKIALGSRLVKLQTQCMRQPSQDCSARLAELQRKDAEIDQRMGQQQPTDYSQELQRLEQRIPGYAEHQRESARLAEQIAAIEADASRAPATNSHQASTAPPPISADLEPLGISQVQSLLSASDALVTFLIGYDGAFVWVVTHDDARWSPLELNEAELGDLVFALRCGLDLSMWADERADRCRSLLGREPAEETIDGKRLRVYPFDAAQAYRLYKALLEPFNDIIRRKRLIIVPSGALTMLPFNVLIAAPPKTPQPARLADYRGLAWLGADQPIAVLPSVGALKAIGRMVRTKPALRPYLGIGNPLLEGDPDDPRWGVYSKQRAQAARDQQSCGARDRLQVAEVSRGVRPPAPLARIFRSGRADLDLIKSLEPLPETAEEVCDIARQLGVSDADVLLGARATETALRQLSASGRLAEYGVLHFATHGALSGQVQGTAEPGLIMTPPAKASTIEDDGFLAASEIAALKLDADWVLLSACNTAAGADDNAEALAGLARAFLFAGARGLLVSHWPVGSDAAVKLVTRTFAELRHNPAMQRAEALRVAMRALIDEGSVAYAHPSQWAPFVLVADATR